MMRKKIKIMVPCTLALVMAICCFSFSFAANSVSGVKLKAGARAVKVSWSAYSGATRYEVNCNGKDYSTKSTLYKVDKLTPNTKYGFVVRAYKGKELLAESATVYGTTLGIKDVTDFKANPGYKSITLTFKKVKGASYYELYRKDKKSGKFKLIKKLTNKKNTDKKYNKKYIYYKDTGKDTKEKEIRRNVTYTYRVRAVKKKPGGGRWVSGYSTAKDKAVRQMYQDIKVNGRWHTANGYSGGTYYTTEGNAYSVTSVSAATCDYSKTKNYSKRSAENFVNELMKAGKFSRRGKKRMIWISTYTQHIYVFKWKNNMWRFDRGWECSTGKAGSATPMGFDKYIHNKTGYRRGISYWSFFQTLNALHGLGSYSDHSGEPVSGGCVRNPDSRAKWIYEKCSIGTPVVSW